MIKAYIVFGQCGEYSDKTEWIVKAFTTEKRAQDYEHECMLWASRNQEKVRGIYNYNEQVEFQKSSPDPHYRNSHTGTDYYTVPMDIEE